MDFPTVAPIVAACVASVCALVLAIRANARVDTIDPKVLSARLEERFEAAVSSVQQLRVQMAALAEEAALDKEAATKRLARARRAEQAAEEREEREAATQQQQRQQQHQQNSQPAIDWSALLVK